MDEECADAGVMADQFWVSETTFDFDKGNENREEPVKMIEGAQTIALSTSRRRRFVQQSERGRPSPTAIEKRISSDS